MVLLETDVWDAFRALPLEGEGLYAELTVLLERGAFFSAGGDTLEIGAGDGQLWRESPRLLATCLEAGRLHLTDADDALVAASASSFGDDVVCESVEAAALPYDAGRFARVLAVHVLHWCGNEAACAVREIGRVLAPNGHAIVVTVDERRHMREVYDVLRTARDELARDGLVVPDEIPEASPRVLPFCAANADAMLRASFADVMRRDLVYAHRLDAVHPTLGTSAGTFMTAYLETLPFVRAGLERGTIPRALLQRAGALVDDEIARRGAFRMSRCDVVYECSRPR